MKKDDIEIIEKQHNSTKKIRFVEIDGEIFVSENDLDNIFELDDLTRRITQLEQSLEIMQKEKKELLSNNVIDFISAYCLIEPKGKTKFTALYNRYLEYCEQKHTIPFTKAIFKMKIQECFNTLNIPKIKRKIQGYEYYYITIIEDKEEKENV
jgi:hypothetical protein